MATQHTRDAAIISGERVVDGYSSSRHIVIEQQGVANMAANTIDTTNAAGTEQSNADDAFEDDVSHDLHARVRQQSAQKGNHRPQ